MPEKDDYPKPRTPAASVVPVFSFPTPKGRQDIVFYVEKDGDLPINQQWTYGEAPIGAPKTKYPNHKLVYVSDQTPEMWSRWYYALSREDQDDYNWELSTADIGGRKFDAVRRTYVTLRSGFNPAAPAPGDAMPNVPVGLFSGYVFSDKEQRRSQDPVLDSLFVTDVHTYIKRTTIRTIGVDDLNGRTLYKDETLYYETETNVGGTGLTTLQLFAATTNSFWGIQTNGTQRSGEQLSDHWYLVTTAQVISGTPSGGGLIISNYETTENHYWPPVLDTLELMDWEKREGGEEIFPRILFDPEGYNGPCTAQVTIQWKSTPFSGLTIDTMEPQRIYYGSPYFTLNVPECLHASLNVICDIGTSDPVYKQNAGSSRNFPATSPASRPASVTAVDDQKPFRGGYLRTTIVIDEP